MAIISGRIIITPSNVRLGKRHRMLHCGVLPTSEFNGMIAIYSENSIMTAVTFSYNFPKLKNYKPRYKVTNTGIQQHLSSYRLYEPIVIIKISKVLLDPHGPTWLR